MCTGYAQVVHRVIHMWPFTRRPSALTKRDLERCTHDLNAALDRLHDEVQALRAQHLKLRGRVYALWGAGKDPDEGRSADDPTNPELSKDAVRAILRRQGRLHAVPHQE